MHNKYIIMHNKHIIMHIRQQINNTNICSTYFWVNMHNYAKLCIIMRNYAYLCIIMRIIEYFNEKPV